MLPLFNEDAVLPARIMVVVPVVKVYVLLLHLVYIFFIRRMLCQRDWVSWVIWQWYVHCCGKWHVIVNGDKTLITNYSSISLLPVFSKILK